MHLNLLHKRIYDFIIPGDLQQAKIQVTSGCAAYRIILINFRRQRWESNCVSYNPNYVKPEKHFNNKTRESYCCNNYKCLMLNIKFIISNLIFIYDHNFMLMDHLEQINTAISYTF